MTEQAAHESGTGASPVKHCALKSHTLHSPTLPPYHPPFTITGLREHEERSTCTHQNKQALEAAGWQFFAEGKNRANIQLEPSVTLKTTDLDALGDNFEKTEKSYIDFLLLNEKCFPFIVLEAKSEDKNPLHGKEQARKYARSQNCRFVILSNGNLHYFWDLERGKPP